jgi:Zn-dependent protease with chaperone function
MRDTGSSMTHEEYSALVSRLETFAAAKPGSYRLRVGALALLGYAYVLGIILLLLTVLVLMVWGILETHAGVLLVKLVLPVLALLAALGRALWVRVAPPEGRELQRSEAPKLFSEIEAVGRAARASLPHHVVITYELNASVYQVPRLGIFGFHRTYLVVGLPLLAATTPDQFRAVLAHEFGHLSRAHAHFGNWIYLVRGTWAQIDHAIRQRRSRLGTLLVNRFVEWYEPYFRAYSFVLARRHEVEADQTSAAVSGSRATAMALAAIALRARYKNEIVWPMVTARIVNEPTPPRAAFTGYVQQMPAGLPLGTAIEWLAAGLRVESGVDDPHPALAARLESLGELPSDQTALSAMAEQLAQPIDPDATAGAHYLGPLAASIASELDDRWRGDVTASWKDRHGRLTRAREGLRELTARAQETSLTPDEQFQVADWTEDLQGAGAAFSLVQALVESHPSHAPGLYMLGRMLLATGDEAGIAYLERAMEIDPDATGLASSLIARHLQQTGRRQESIAYRTRAEASLAEEAAANAERGIMAQHDKLGTAELEDAALARLREQLADVPEVGRAWLGRKVTYYAPDRPFYVLGISRSAPWWRFVSEGSNTHLARKLADDLEVPAGTLVVVLDRKRKWLRRALKKVPDSEVYRRGR